MTLALTSSPFVRNLILFNTLSFLGFFSVLAVLGPALFSRHVKRPRTWFGMLLSWLLYSISYLLLIGHQVGPEPPLGLCIFQASLIYATTPLAAASTMCFAFDFLTKLSTISSNGSKVHKSATMILVMCFPWVLAFTVFGVVTLSVDNPLHIQRNINNFYCHNTQKLPYLMNGAIIYLFGSILVPLEIYTAILLRRNWTLFRRLRGTRSRIALSTLVRLALFSLIVSIPILLSTVAIIHPNPPTLLTTWRMTLVLLPTLAALCLGTQRDIIEVWLFWKKGKATQKLTLGTDIHIRNDSRMEVVV